MDLSKCNVIWLTPSDSSLGSMPLGNGDVGANVWFTPDGVLHLYLSKTDAWDETHYLRKLGELAIEFDPSLQGRLDQGFRHELILRAGRQEILVGPADEPALRIGIWIDAHRPLLWIECDRPCGQAVACKATLSTWRTQRRAYAPGELHAPVAYAPDDPANEMTPDVMLSPPLCGESDIGLCHRNETSVLTHLLEHQYLEDLVGQVEDNLLGRTFGGVMAATTGSSTVERDGWRQTLTAEGQDGRITLAYAAHCQQTDTLADWSSGVGAVLDDARTTDLDAARADHERWWGQFWDRSFIDATGDAVADRITQVYQLQRYVTACAGRGEFPIKFNGSIFTMQGPAETPHRRSGSPTIFTPDYRRWGGGYWFQNTRLNYWPMLAAGDTEMMHPWFEMHRRAAPLCRHRVRKHLGLDGLFFPETMTIWGTWLNGGFRENRPEDLRLAFHPNRFTRRYWQGSLELSTVMLEYLDHTGDEGWWNEVAYPIVRDAVAFYRSYYHRRDEDGKVLFEPSQSLETWHVARNPTPDIAGLRHVLGQLLALPESAVPADDRAGFEAYLAELPEVPVEQYDERFPGRLLPAEKYDDLRNMENCELYAVFPYPLGALGGELYEQAQSAWPVRRMRAVVGWMQDAVHAAMLGLAEEAAEAIAAAFVPDDIFEPHLKYRWSAPQDPAIRFPAFFGPNFDWVPDQDHGTVNCLALQKMCLQTQHGRLRVLPAWPGRWDVHFRLHAPGRTVVECQVRAGKITALTVTPEARQADVVQPQEVG